MNVARLGGRPILPVSFPRGRAAVDQGKVAQTRHVESQAELEHHPQRLDGVTEIDVRLLAIGTKRPLAHKASRDLVIGSLHLGMA